MSEAAIVEKNTTLGLGAREISSARNAKVEMKAFVVHLPI